MTNLRKVETVVSELRKTTSPLQHTHSSSSGRKNDHFRIYDVGLHRHSNEFFAHYGEHVNYTVINARLLIIQIPFTTIRGFFEGTNFTQLLH